MNKIKLFDEFHIKEDEGRMAKYDAKEIAEDAMDVFNMIDEEDNLPEWLEAKITIAADYMNSVKDYLTHHQDQDSHDNADDDDEWDEDDDDDDDDDDDELDEASKDNFSKVVNALSELKFPATVHEDLEGKILIALGRDYFKKGYDMVVDKLLKKLNIKYDIAADSSIIDDSKETKQQHHIRGGI